MTPVAQAVSIALLHFVWQALFVAFGLWVALLLLRNHSANARYAASCTALALMAALPVITACLAYSGPLTGHVSPSLVRAIPRMVRAISPISAPSPTIWLPSFERWALPAWALGVLLFSLRLVWAARQVSALRREAQPPDAPVLEMISSVAARMGLHRPFRVLISSIPDCPSVIGWIRPIVLLPVATVLGLTPQQLEAVLAHELAHIHRYDYLVNMLQVLVETLLFYHPAVWWTSAQIRAEREMCCDDLAVAACGDALCYARALTRLERLRVLHPRLALGSTDGPLFYRIRRLIGDQGQDSRPSKAPGILAISIGLVCLALNMQWAHGQPPQTRTLAQAAVASATIDEPGIQVDLGGATVIHRDPVEYPRAARKTGVQGTVTVEVTLDADGIVSDARVLNGPAELRKAALQSVLRWHFTHDLAGSMRRVAITFHTPAAGNIEKQEQIERAWEEQARAENLAQEDRSELLEKKLEEADEALDSAQDPLREEQTEAISRELQLLQERQAERAQIDPAQAEAVKSQIAALEKSLLDAKRALDRDWEPHKEQAAALQKQLQLMQEQQALAASMDAAKTDALNSQLTVMTKRLAEEQQLLDSAGDANWLSGFMAGRTLKSIRILGLTDKLRSELLAQLPVHVGDTLSADSFARIEAAVRQFDDSLSVGLQTNGKGQVELRIASPNAGSGWTLRK